jgi:hypothetical protein
MTVLFKKIFEFFAWGIPQDFFRKNFFHQKHTNDVFLESVFNGDYEFDIILIEKLDKWTSILKFMAFSCPNRPVSWNFSFYYQVTQLK